jgi:hypothetical protein
MRPPTTTTPGRVVCRLPRDVRSRFHIPYTTALLSNVELSVSSSAAGVRTKAILEGLMAMKGDDRAILRWLSQLASCPLHRTVFGHHSSQLLRTSTPPRLSIYNVMGSFTFNSMASRNLFPNIYNMNIYFKVVEVQIQASERIPMLGRDPSHPGAELKAPHPKD